MRTAVLLAAAASFAAIHPALAQVQNPFFETGSFTPWTITPTAAGNTISSAIVPYDIDGSGPFSMSNAARFMVGRNAAVTSAEGIVLSQPLSLRAGVDYSFHFFWSVHAIVNVYSQTGGIFELMINGTVLNSATAPTTTPGQFVYGVVAASYRATQTGPHTLGIRITRPVPMGEEVFQYVDIIRGSCYPDCDGQGSMNGNDFQCFLNAFAAGLPYANCDGSTGNPAHTANDFQCYLDKYALGCW